MTSLEREPVPAVRAAAPRTAGPAAPAPASVPLAQDVRPGDAAGAVAAVVASPGLLSAHVQPIVDLQTGSVAGYEVLSRVPQEWRVRPDRLFAAARALGQSADLTRTVLVGALALLDRLPDNTFLTVNVDPVDLPTPEAVQPLFQRASLSRLVLEITEHEWPQDHVAVDRLLAAVRERGALVAADDVGAGWAGLKQLLHVRPDLVKVDRDLIRPLGRDPAAEAMLHALGDMCGRLDAWVVAEGVEDEVQLAALVRMGVPLAQGWLLGRPAPPFPPGESGDLVRRRASMARLSDMVVTLLRPGAPDHERDPHGRWRRKGDSAPCLVVAPSTPLPEAVQRALSRPPEQRWTELLVTDTGGRVLGTVSMESLVAAVARAATAPPA